MKGFFSVIGWFAAFFVFGTVLGGLCTAAYAACTAYSIGGTLHAADGGTIAYAFFFSFLVTAFLAPLVISLVLVRRQKPGIPRISAFVLCTILIWTAVFPGWIYIYRNIMQEQAFPRAVPAASAGYFREDAAGIVYYSAVHPDKTADGIYIDISGLGGQAASIQPLHSAPVNAGTPYPFSDLLVQDGLKKNRSIVSIQDALAVLYEAGLEASSHGWGAWLGFASIALAFCVFPCIGSISRWRIHSFLFIPAGSMLLWLTNAIFLSPAAFSFISKNPSLYQTILSADPIIRILLNLGFCLLFILSAAIASVVHSGSLQEDDE